jgi:uncharacterized protein YkwD
MPSANGTGTQTAAPSHTPALPDVTGTVVDDTSGKPIAGAAVYVSEATIIAGATPPPASATPWPAATTAADGSFDVSNVAPSMWTASFAYVGTGYPVYTTAQWIDVFPTDGHAAYHAIHTIAATGTTNLGSIQIALPSAADSAWLNQINADRANIGVPPVNSPLIFDSVTLQTARYWAQQMATGNFFAHTCPPAPTTCVEFWLYETQHGSIPSSQNIDQQPANATWQNAEAAFMGETANCPGANWQTCPFSESTGHYINIMSATNWAGVASNSDNYVENFATPISVIQSAAPQARSRRTAITLPFNR